MLSSPVYAEFHPRPNSLPRTISRVNETSLFLVTPLLPCCSALFSAMAPTHLHFFQSLTHSFHRDGGCTPSQRKAAISARPLPPLSSQRRASTRTGSGCLRVRLSRSFPAPSHQIPPTSLFSFTYKLPIFYPLCFDIHACNGGVYPHPIIQTLSSLSFGFLPFTGGVPLKTKNLQLRTDHRKLKTRLILARMIE